MWLVATTTVAGNLPIRLEAGEYVVGRRTQAQIVIAHSTVSRRHARLIVTHTGVTVEDLGSANGTRVNDRPVAKSELNVGDQVQFGGIVCLLVGSPLAARATGDDERTHPLRTQAARSAAISGLTPTQRDIVELLLDGQSKDEIAVLLHRSPHTIHTHLKAIFERLGVHSRAELLSRYLRRG
jgi:DNA-binding CsgD family transcriptional regulator